MYLNQKNDLNKIYRWFINQILNTDQMLSVDKVQRRAAGIILSKCRSYILLVFQKESGNWGLPKGEKYDNESYWQCMHREIREEVNMDLLSIPFSTEWRGRLKNLNTHFYLIRLNKDIEIAPVKKAHNEIGDVRWVKKSEIPNLKLNAVSYSALKFMKII